MMHSGVMHVDANPYKRPASPTAELSMPPAKIPKTAIGQQLQINYLKREKKDTIPLATADEPLPRLLRLISEYDGVLQRHESLAGNLGACPVGPILLKRFERLFEGPPRILKSNSRDPNITWLDVVEFAQNKPEQFDLEKTRNGIRVCQFYLKQCRVEISEEDYVLIRSGMPQKLIPPQPILEDEEKELGVIEVLDRNLGKVVHSADQISARARQLVHRLKQRRAAILARREADGDVNRSVLKSNDQSTSPALGVAHVPEHNGAAIMTNTRPPPPPTTQSPSMHSSGFTAVNPRHLPHPGSPAQPSLVRPDRPQLPPMANGSAMVHEQRSPPLVHTRPLPTETKQSPASASEDWMNKFLTPSERAAGMTPETIRREAPNSAPRPVPTSRGETVPVQDALRMADLNARRQEARRQSEGAIPERPPEQSTSSVAIPGTPASLMPQQKPNTWNRDDGGPYKAEMISRMETMKRGERVIPPCDRCRRLHMDCIKNLTACLGCTKKHAKCSWKDVSLEELESTASVVKERAEKDGEIAIPSSTEWDNILKRTRTSSDATGTSPAGNSKDGELASNKSSTPRVASPTTAVSTQNPPQESPRLNLRPPPLEPPTRDAAEPPKPSTANGSATQPARYSPFARPSSAGRQATPTRPKAETSEADDGDRLAALAEQVYRSQSQNAVRSSEGKPESS